MAVKKARWFCNWRAFLLCSDCLRVYLRFLAGVPPRALGSLLPPRAAGAALLLLLEADVLLLRLTSWLLASARALRAARLGR